MTALRHVLKLAAAPTIVLAAVALAPLPAAAAPPAGPARFQVDSTADEPDAGSADGACRTAGGHCTLRAAVMAANTRPGSTIVVPAGRYALRIPPPFGKPFTDYTLLDVAHGNLKILAPMRITGAGAGRTIVDGQRLDRVFTVLRPAAITDLTVTGGLSAPLASAYNYYGGGGLLNASDLTMERVRLTGNEARFGGAIQNIPFTTFILRDSTVDGNEAGEAGGIRFDWKGRVENSTITGNRVVDPHDPTRPAELAGFGGGIDVRGLDVTVVGSRITDNYAEKGGGGLNITFGYVPGEEGTRGPGHLQLKDSVVTANTSADGPANCRAVLASIVDLGGNAVPDGDCG